jgi:hypothetical protein
LVQSVSGSGFADRPAPTDSRRSAAVDEARWARLTRLARLFDSRFRVPGTDWRFGLDGLIGLIPGVGDAVGLLVALWILREGHRLGASKMTMLRMLGNIAADGVLGAVPLAGDLFDVAFKANRRNVDLLRRDLGRRVPPATNGRR